jgi:hypothetical protein
VQHLNPLYGGIPEREHQFSELERVTKHIQDEVPGCENFMVPLSKSHIQSLAQEGLIVTLVAGHAQADAILLTNAGTKVLPLTSLLLDAP